MMRILLVAGSYPPEPCGVGDYTEKLANSLAALKDVHVGVLTTSASGRKSTKTSPVELMEVVLNWNFSELPKLIREILQWKPDLVHVQYPSQGFFFRRLPSFLPLVCRLLGIKVIQTWHEPHRMRGALHFLLQTLGASGLIFVRPNYLDMIPALFCKVIKHIHKAIILNASSLPISLLDENKRLELRARYIGSNKRLVVFFGFIYRSKGIEFLFEIANPVSDSLIIAGAVKDKEYMRQLADVAQAKGWREDQLHFVGFLSPQDAADLLKIPDAVVLPFLDGGGEWNTSIHSALAQGTLVITTAIPPRGDEPKRNLFTAAPSDIYEMRAALDRLAGRRSAPISAETQWQRIATAHLDFYRRCTCSDVSKQA
jgi:glycosyltransferase involved in cell wall biosynthesis